MTGPPPDPAVVAGWTRASATLAGALFVYMTAEMFPVGVVPELAMALGCSQAAAGTLLAVYAIAAGAPIIPVVLLTRHRDRRQLIVVSLLVLAASQVTFALADNLWWAYTARVVAAIPHGLLWSAVPTVAASMNVGALGRATARVFVGGALGVVIGAPAVTAETGVIGWHATAVSVGLLADLLAGAARVTLPSGGAATHADSPRQGRARRLPIVPAQVWGALQSAVLAVSHHDSRVDPLATSAVYVLAFQLGIAGGSWAGGGILASAGPTWLAPAGLIAVAVAASIVPAVIPSSRHARAINGPTTPTAS